MGSIRPLVTITILVVVGAYLYVKINEGPVQPRAGKGVVLNQLPDGVPPLQATKGASLASESAAPAWPSNASAATTPAPLSAPTAAINPNPGGAPTMGGPTVLNDVAKNNLPAVPPIPELPEFPATTAATPPAAQASATLPKDLPADIPTARYPDQVATADTRGAEIMKQPTAADNDVIQADVRRILTAVYQNDPDTVLKYSHPMIINMMGGETKAKTDIEAMLSQIRSAGMTIESLTFPRTPVVVKSGSHEFVAVPTKIIVAANEKRVESLNFQLGVRDLGTRDWKYIEGSRINKDNANILFRDFPANFVFPPIDRREIVAADRNSTSLPTTDVASAAQNPLRQSPQAPPSATESADRYASAATTSQLVPIGPAPNQALPQVETSFAASWPTIQAALDRGDLKHGHQLLSKWHGNESLTPADSERVEKLLSQLAGTVIYSSEHQLEPPRVVKPAETLDTIAKEYNVPWQLLAKINGIQGPDQLRPGQELKVVRGPFSAVVDLHRSEVTLMVDDRYAGKFHVSTPPSTTITDGQWLVDQKLAGPASTANPNAFASTPVPADRTIILRNATANAAAPTLLIASGPSPAGIASSPPSLRVSPQDAEELSDILSIGSRVIVRR